MTYHEECWECDHCGKITLDYIEDGWLFERYDKHYCRNCKYLYSGKAWG